MASNTSQLMAGDGVGLLTRHWEHERPRARILIVHGLGEHSGRYEHVGEYLLQHGFDVTAYDHRGHGASGGMRIDLESFDEYLDDLAMMVASIEGDVPLVIYGHSMGGLVAASYAASSRPQPTLYVLSAPAISAEVPLHLRIIAKVGNRLRPMMYFPNSIKGEQLSHDPAVGERYFADPLVETRTTARFGAVLMAQMDSMADKVGSIVAPVLVIHGAEDELVPPQASAPLAAQPNVERKLFPGLRHEIHNEPEQEQVLGYVVSWIDSQLA